MNPPTLNAETEALIQGYLEGTLTPDEAARLLSALKEEPAIIGTILDGLRIDALIRGVVAEAGVVPISDQSSRSAPAATANAMPAADPAQKSAEISPFPLITATEKARRWPLALALAASLALLLGLAAWYFGPTMGQPLLAEVQGNDVSLKRGTEFIPATTGDRIQPADVLRTGTNATAIVTFGPEKTRFALRPGSELKLVSIARGKRFELRQGKLKAIVARQRPFQPMTLMTAQAEARVLGTEFTLAVTTNATTLEVTKGRVKLTRKSDDAVVKVGAGRCAVAASNYELAALPFTGAILREQWSGVAGKSIADLRNNPRYPGHPDKSDLAVTFELEPVKTNQLGVRYCGYLHPPVTGDYEFWLAGATDAGLFMSPSENPSDEVSIALIFDNSRELDKPRFKGPSPWAPPVPLVAGRRYYIEALVLVEKGEGHLSVAWKRPGEPRELLTGKYLSPFKPK